MQSGTAPPVQAAPEPGGALGSRPRLRAGYALKRLDASEGPHRWVLRDLDTDRFHRLADADGELVELLDGSRTLHDLVAEAERRLGRDGPMRLAQLLSELGERGRLASVGGEAAATTQDGPRSLLRRIIGPRVKVLPGFGPATTRLYDRGAWLLFTTPALTAMAVIAATGLIAFVAVIALVYGKPFVVAEKVGLGGAVFILGRFAVAAVHEVAHALAMASVGRQVPRAGIKVMGIFPYVFVDTSEAWFESRMRRICVSLAGPTSDLVLGGIFAIGCALSPEGAVRDVLFNLAFGAYLGAFFNLNPLFDRDGYHILVDVLREPNLRKRVRERLGGRAPDAPPHTVRAIHRYILVGLAWTAAGAAIGLALALHYQGQYADRVSAPVRQVLMGMLFIGLLFPAFLMLVPPLAGRLRARGEVAAVR